MPSTTAQHVKDHAFSCNGRNFVARVWFEPTTQEIVVEPYEAGNRVILTYPDGAKLMPRWTATLVTALDVQQILGLDAIEYLLNDAERMVAELA